MLAVIFVVCIISVILVQGIKNSLLASHVARHKDKRQIIIILTCSLQVHISMIYNCTASIITYTCTVSLTTRVNFRVDISFIKFLYFVSWTLRADFTHVKATSVISLLN